MIVFVPWDLVEHLLSDPPRPQAVLCLQKASVRALRALSHEAPESGGEMQSAKIKRSKGPKPLQLLSEILKASFTSQGSGSWGPVQWLLLVSVCLAQFCRGSPRNHHLGVVEEDGQVQRCRALALGQHFVPVTDGERAKV